MHANIEGTRHLYAAQPIDTGPKQVQYPVAVVNPDNEVECGRKILLDRTPSAKQDPANYFTCKLLRIASEHSMCVAKLDL